MRKLILIKHSHPEIIQTIPSKYWHLSKEGRIRSETLAQTISDYSPFEILSSEEDKAKETAEIISRYHNKLFKIENGLHEHDRESTKYLEDEKWLSTITDFFDRPDQLVFGKETANQAKKRFDVSIQNITRKVTKENIMIVAHGTVMSLFTGNYNHIDHFQFWKKLGLPSIVVLSIPEFKILDVIESIG